MLLFYRFICLVKTNCGFLNVNCVRPEAKYISLSAKRNKRTAKYIFFKTKWSRCGPFVNQTAVLSQNHQLQSQGQAQFEAKLDLLKKKLVHSLSQPMLLEVKTVSYIRAVSSRFSKVFSWPRQSSQGPEQCSHGQCSLPKYNFSSAGNGAFSTVCVVFSEANWKWWVNLHIFINWYCSKKFFTQVII